MANYVLNAADLEYLRKQGQNAVYKGQTNYQEPKNDTNVGGLAGGIGFLGQKIGLGALQGIEGIVDYTAGGLAKLFGNDEYAEQLFSSDWTNYNAADEWFNPEGGWKVAGDIAGGIGSSLPGMAGAALGAAIIIGSGGALSSVGSQIIVGSISATIAGLGAAGTSTKEAYNESGQLTGKEFGYGALSGATEAGVEFATAGLAKGSGRIVSSIGKAAAKESAEATAKSVAKTVTKTGAKQFFKDIGEDFVTEAIEEGFSEYISPYYQRMTYNPDAENATPDEIAYAALIGGLSGVAMSGGSSAIGSGINSVKNYTSGNTAVEKGTAYTQIEMARQLSEKDDANETNAEVKKVYDKLIENLKKTNGVTSDAELTAMLQNKTAKFNAKDKMLLGAVKNANVIATFDPYISHGARAMIMDADNVAQKYSAFGIKDSNGNALNITAEDLTKGLSKNLIEKAKSGTLTNKEARILNTELAKALRENTVLATLAASEATGSLMVNTKKMAESVLRGGASLNANDLNTLIEQGKQPEIKALMDILGVQNIETLTADELNYRLAQFRDSGNAKVYIDQVSRIKEAIKHAGDEAKPLPKVIGKNKNDGVYRYKKDGVDLAIFKKGDFFYVYDYTEGDLSFQMSLNEVNKLLSRLWKGEDTASNRTESAEGIDTYAKENIDGYNELNEPNKAAVRMTIRQAKAYNLTDSQIKLYGTVVAKSGLNVVFDKTIGDGFLLGNTIYANPNISEGRTYEMLLGHEMFHRIFETGSKKAFKLYKNAKKFLNKDEAKRIEDEYTAFYKKHNATADNALIEEEIAAAGSEEVFKSEAAWEYILGEEPTLGDKVLSFFRKSAREYSSIQGMSAQARKFLRQYKKLFDKIVETNRTSNAFAFAMEGTSAKTPGGNLDVDPIVLNMSPEEAKISGKIDDARFSLAFAKDIAKSQKEYVEKGNGKITAEELDKAINDTAVMVDKMIPYADILPQDKVGKTLVKNGSYDVSVENTTVCIRTLAYNAFVDMVSEKVGRPLTQMESFLVSQKLYEIAKEPQCLYCYVSLDRKAFNEMIIRYVEQRDTAIAEYEKAGKPKIPSSFNAEWSLFKDFLAGRKPTENMWDRYTGWLKSYNSGERLVTLEDISTEAKRLEIVESNGTASAQVKDILKYAQSASWAKKQTQYVAYTDEILKLKPTVISNLNKHYGMRWYSFSDYSGAFIVENMQQITDAAIRGLKGLSYTKDTDFAEIFAPTGMNINISVYAKKTENGYEIDPKQSADINKAIDLRKKYPNVGIVVVATDVGGVEWALSQEWSDVVIPFHTVRTGADVASFYNWEIFNSEQSDVVSDENLWDAYVKQVNKKKVSKMVYPSEHQNNKDKYLSICKERGLTPRFKSFLDNPNYMKLVNETRQSESQTSPLKPKFDVKAAERSFDKFVEKGGYYEGWYNDGIDVDSEAEIVASDVRSGKKANEVSYGRQDISFKDFKRNKNRTHGRAALNTDTEGNTLTEAQQRFFENSKVRDKDGRLLVVYHGTPKENGDFYVFDYEKAKRKGGFGFSSFGKGYYFTTNKEGAEIYTRSGGRLLNVYLNIKNPYIVTGNIKEQISKDFDIDPLDVHLNEVQDFLKSKGYDGILTENEIALLAVAYSPEQIKLTSNKNPTLNPDIRFALSKDVDNYAIDQYNRTGWAKELLSGEDKQIFYDLIKSTNSDTVSPHFTDHKYLYEVNNKLIISNGDFENPTIDAIIDINVDNATDMEDLLKEIGIYGKNRKRQTSKKFYKIVEGRIDKTIFRLYYGSDYRYSVSNSGLSYPTRQNGYKDFGYSREQRYGGNGRPRIRGYNEGTDTVTVEYQNGDTEKMSYEEYDILKGRFALPKSTLTNDIAYGSVERVKRPTMKEKAEAVVSGTIPSITATEIQLTNAQAGIEYAGRKLGMDNIESLVQRVRASRSMAQEMIGGNQYEILPGQTLNEVKHLGQGLEPILSEIRDRRNGETKEQAEERYTAYQYYLYHKHNVDRMSLKEKTKDSEKPEDNKPVLRKLNEKDEYVPVTAEESLKAIEEYEKQYPEFKKNSEKVYGFLNRLLELQVKYGLITEELYTQLREKYPHYVPTFIVENKMGTAPIRGKGNIEVAQTVKKATGSIETLDDLELSISRMVEKVIRAGNVNLLANSLIDAANGDTRFIKEVSREKTKENLFENEDNKETPKKNQITVYRNGEKITLAVTPEVFAGFDDFNSKDDAAILPIRAVSAMTNGFKTLVTSANPIFLVRNMIRDLQDAGINTRYAKAFVKNYARAIYHLSHNTELAQIYRAAGGFNASIFDYARGFTGKQSKMGFTNSTKKMRWVLNKIENANMFIEQLPRFAEFISSVEAGKSVDQAILDAADVTTNFGRSGKLTRKLNQTIIPFLNPAVQGLSKIYRNFKDAFRSRKAFTELLIKCVILGIIPMAFNNLLYSDDEEYEDIKDTDKENNYLFKVGSTWIKIPKGRFVSVLAGLANRTETEIEGGDADWKEYVDNVISQVTPVENFTRPIWSPITDVNNNKTWYGSAIEGMQFENKRPSERYDESTSSIAIAIGKAINYSPKKIHYLLDQYSGVIGDFVLPATTQKAESGFVVSSFVFDPVVSNRLSNDFYKLYEEAQYNKSDGDITAKYQLKYLNEVKTAVSKMYDEISEIQKSDLTTAEKLQQTRVIRMLINNAYKTAKTDYDTYTEAVKATDGLYDETKESGVRLRYTDITHRVYGAAKAFEVYNDDIAEKMKVINSCGIDYEKLYYYYFATRDLEADYDKDGNTVSGSKRKKVLDYINSLNVSADHKLMLLAIKGYSPQDGDIKGVSAETAKKRLVRFILNLKGKTKQEKIEIAEICGLKVKNGAIVIK